jgi:hypothetical protein
VGLLEEFIHHSSIAGYQGGPPDSSETVAARLIMPHGSIGITDLRRAHQENRAELRGARFL